MSSIIGFDWMKLSRDKVGNQPSQTLLVNILDLVKKEFPGITHISISTPLDSNTEFIANKVTPSPLSVETFIDMQIDEIHKAGLNVNLRSFPSSLQKAYNFPLAVKTSDAWVAVNKAFLESHATHLKSGDMISLWYELDWWQRDFGTSINDTGNQVADTNTFIEKNAAMVQAFAKEHNLTLSTRTAYSDVAVTYPQEAVVKAQGAVVTDTYGSISEQTDQATIIGQMQNHITTVQATYPNTIFQIQEWGDIRNSTPDGEIQLKDPTLTANIADQVFFPAIKKGNFEVFFWDLFDTPKEGILTITGDTAVLNPKGIALATVFQKWYGTVIPTPTPAPTPTIPSFSVPLSGNVISDGKGNITVTLTGKV